MTDAPAAKNIIRICPLLSSAITYEKRDDSGKTTRYYDIARSPCIRGECELFDVATFSCIFKKVNS